MNFKCEKKLLLSLSFIPEPLKLAGEGEYNLNNLKQIRVTDSYLGLGQDVRGCQTKESLNTCRTKHYMKSLLRQCKCLPFNIRLAYKVRFFVAHNKCYISILYFFYRCHFVMQPNSNVSKISAKLQDVCPHVLESL